MKLNLVVNNNELNAFFSLGKKGKRSEIERLLFMKHIKGNS